MAKDKLVLASNNAHKTIEIRAALAPWFDVISMREAGVDAEIEETGTTFEENALIKVNALNELTGLTCIADDSGIEVDALNGAPGVYSARYSGAHGDDAANNLKLLSELENVPAPRHARFVCVIALKRPGKAAVIARGECEGEILLNPSGAEGFGYDPLFFSPELGKTFAEASVEEKNTISHRGRAIAKLIEMIGDEK